jgi:hypothetical protein
MGGLLCEAKATSVLSKIVRPGNRNFDIYQTPGDRREALREGSAMPSPPLATMAG